MFSPRVFAGVFASGAALLVLRGAFESSSNYIVQVSTGTKVDGGVEKVVEPSDIWNQVR